jgi:hypothetical protein
LSINKKYDLSSNDFFSCEKRSFSQLKKSLPYFPRFDQNGRADGAGPGQTGAYEHYQPESIRK